MGCVFGVVASLPDQGAELSRRGLSFAVCTVCGVGLLGEVIAVYARGRSSRARRRKSEAVRRPALSPNRAIGWGKSCCCIFVRVGISSIGSRDETGVDQFDVPMQKTIALAEEEEGFQYNVVA